MAFTQIRRLSLKVFLGFLGLTALVAIISVLIGEFGEIEIKILLTCFAISAASMCSMSCAAFIEKRRLTAVGLAGMVLSIGAAFFVVFGIWLEIDGEGFWKSTATFCVVAVAVAHTLLLLIPQLDDNQRWLQWATSIAIGVLAAQIVIAMWGEIDAEGYYRILTAVAIIVGLGTLSIPILMKMHRGAGDRRGRKLVLEQVSESLYMDSAGKRYRLQEVDDGQAGGAQESSSDCS